MAKTSNTSRHRGRHVFDAVVAKKFEGSIGSPGAGNTFYVDGISGSDGNSGRYAGAALLTVDAALGLCTTEHDDYIFVMDAWDEDDGITVDKSMVHIIGINNPQSPWACLYATTATSDMFQLSATANHSEIAGFNIGGGASAACIAMGDATGMWIHNNAFGHQFAVNTPLYAITNENGGVYQNPSFALIEDNMFFGDQASVPGLITSNAIYCAGAQVWHWVVRNNTFMGFTGASIAGAIYIDGGRGFQIHDNLFLVPNAANGEAINLQATTGSIGNLITNNKAAYGMLSNGYSYNPFRDLNTNTLNAWSLNYRGNQIAEPIGA